MTDTRVVYDVQTPLSAVTRATAVEIDEALNEPYVVRLELTIEDPDVGPDALLGQDLTVQWTRDTHVGRVHGVARAVAARPPVHDKSRFSIEIVPAFFMLSMRRDTRIFQEKTVPDILEEVLGDGLSPYGRSMKKELRAEYPSREYCVQYQETDLDFVHRLMEEEGITYRFDHAGDVEEMVLTDDNDAFERAEGADDPVPFKPNTLAIKDVQPVHRFLRAHASTTTAIALRDFDWTASGFLVEAEAGGADALGKTRESYEHGWGRSLTIGDYDAGARRYQKQDGTRQQDVRLEAHVVHGRVGSGVGRVVGFRPGTTFELTGHPVVGIDGEYLLTRVQHRARQVTEALGAKPDASAAEAYYNTFECIPLDVPHRPKRKTEKPRIASLQTAVVTGRAGEEITTDEHARIKVLFPWDRVSAADETSSCWIRVQQKWAGSGWGFLWLPRIGMEVVVEFVDGDPDRPLVTGSVYDGEHGTPYALPDDKTKSTIKSNSSPGGGGSNELRFEDAAGSEQIYTHAQKDYVEVVENDHETTVHHDQTVQVDNDQTQTIHANQREDVSANQSMTVDGDRSVEVSGNYEETIDGTETRNVTGDVTETFSANEARKVGSNLDEEIGANEDRSIGASQTELVGGDHAVVIGGSSTEMIGGPLSQTVLGGIKTVTPGAWTLTAIGGLTIVAAAGIELVGTGGWNLAAPGGVQQIDTFRDWIGFLFGAKGAFARGICGAKHENFGMHLCYTHAKVGVTGVQIPNLGTSFKLGTTKSGQRGCKMDMLGVEAHKWGGDFHN